MAQDGRAGESRSARAGGGAGGNPEGSRGVALTRHAPATFLRCLRHLLRFPEGTQSLAGGALKKCNRVDETVVRFHC